MRVTILIYQNMEKFLTMMSQNLIIDALLDLIKKLDLRKKERMSSFFKVAESIQSKKNSINIEFFKSLISKISSYKLSSEDQLKTNEDIKKIIENAHREIVQDHISKYLNNK